MLKKIIFGLSICLWVMAGNAWAQGLPDTGQTKCYNNSVEIPCPTPGSDFYGQDAEYVKARSYTDLGNGIIQDNVTGLMWQQATAPGTDTWGGAIAYCADLHLGPYSDWRLPTIKELSTLVNSNIPYPGPTINTAYFPDTVASGYWSSTINAYDTYDAWTVDFTYGDVYYGYGMPYFHYVRAVRAGPLPDNNFIDHGDGTLTDTSTGLMWQKATAPSKYTWQQALDYCANLELGPYSDWRLPDINELQLLVDYSRYNPSINTTYFPDTVASNYWSSTTDAYYTGYAWYVNFYDGYVLSYDKTYFNYVRAVRSGQYVLSGDLGYLCIEDYHCDEGETCEEGMCRGECASEVDCDDGLFCTGVETCVSEECVAGTNPCISQDLVCNEDVDLCVECLDDSNCPVGKECVNGACVAITCTENWNCPSGFGCVEGACIEEAPPVIKGGPWLAAGYWPILPTSSSNNFELDQNYSVLWTFSDDYATCDGLCSHRARYQKIGETIWKYLAPQTNPTGKKSAYVELPVDRMVDGDYRFVFDLFDCAGQLTTSRTYYFKVVHP